MKVKILNQSMGLHLGMETGEGVLTVDAEQGKALIDAGYAEAVSETKVERATKAPGEKSTASKPEKKSGLTTKSMEGE
jgi:hypothetical protein